MTNDTSAETRPGPRDRRGVLAARTLEVARRHFAERGYAGTSIRGIARDAGVDPGLVHHYYGSKDDLLDACTTPPESWAAAIAATWTTPVEELGAALVARTLANWRSAESVPILRSILLIAAHHPPTRERLRAIVAMQLMGPARIGIDEDDRRLRSGLVASQLLGLALMRYVWEIEPVAGMTDEAVVALVGPTVQRYIDGDLGRARG